MTGENCSRRGFVLGAMGAAVLGAAQVSILSSCASSSSGGLTTDSGGDAALDLSNPDYAPLAQAGGAVKVTVGGEKLVVMRKSDTEVVALSSVCTHLGCSVDLPAGNQLSCPCHGSAFDAATGAAIRGPASRPLASYPARIAGNRILVTVS